MTKPEIRMTKKAVNSKQKENDAGKLGLGLPNIFFSVVKEPWWNGRITTTNLCVLCALCGEEG